MIYTMTGNLMSFVKNPSHNGRCVFRKIPRAKESGMNAIRL